MAEQLVTIAVVPHERFSLTKRSLASVLAHSPPGTPLVYIDGGSPPLVRQYLEQQAARHGFRLVSTERFVAPNVARNLAAALAGTKYVAFIDNDVVVSPGWLEPLVECAESTAAWIVGPVCCEGEPPAARIHSAGGTARLVEHHGRRVLRNERRHHGRPLSAVVPPLTREAVGEVEFHAALVRSDAFHRLGPLDERLLSAVEHTDFCLQVHSRGGAVYLEPASVVTYVPPPPFESFDLPYFQQRWSDGWNTASIEHFRDKWELAHDDEQLRLLAERLAEHRRLTLETARRALRLLGRKPARWLENVLIAPFERAFNRRRFPPVPHDAPRELRRAA